jgi:CHAD domain-containing protein
MALDSKSLVRPFRKLRRALKDFSDVPIPEDVHALRTQARRVEAAVQALQLERKAVGSNLLKSMKPIRKAAGDVRDMDVLVGFASSLEHGAEDQDTVQLLEYLGSRRTKAAARLHKIVASRRQEMRKYLNQCLRLIEDEISPSKKALSEGHQLSINAMAVSLQLETELADWPKLTTENIHPFRLKVKELRYILQLAEGENSKFSEALGEVKDQIGVWHDWTELATIANKVLNQGHVSPLSRQTQERAKAEFVKALEAANAMRTRYLNKEALRGTRKKGSPTRLNASTIAATSRLAG